MRGSAGIILALEKDTDLDVTDPEEQARLTQALFAQDSPATILAVWRWLERRGFHLRAPVHPFILALQSVVCQRRHTPDRSLVGVTLLNAVGAAPTADLAGLMVADGAMTGFPVGDNMSVVGGLGAFLLEAVPLLEEELPPWLPPLVDALVEALSMYPFLRKTTAPEVSLYPRAFPLIACALTCLPTACEGVSGLGRTLLHALLPLHPDKDTALRAIAHTCMDLRSAHRYENLGDVNVALIVRRMEAALVAPRMHALAARSRRVTEQEVVWAAHRAARPHEPADVAGAGAGAGSARDGVRPRLGGGLAAAIVRQHMRA
jgi:hypothetical protein